MADHGADIRHRLFLAGEEQYPPEFAQHVRDLLYDIATHAGRGEITEAISVVYAIHGEHEGWLSQAPSAKTEADYRSALDGQ